MFSTNISCAVCKAAFKMVDSIYSTACGHIFHFSCMNQWKARSSSCPVCRSFNPTSHPLYINFENEIDYESVVNDLKAKLEVCENKCKQLAKDISKELKDKDSVKRLYNVSEQWRAELEDKIKVLQQQQQQEKNEHTLELAKSLEEITILKSNIEMLERGDDVVEELNKKYQALRAENIKLKKKLDECEPLNIQLKQKLEMQELRLKHMTLELTKQIDECFKNTNSSLSLESLENKPPALKQKKNNNRLRPSQKKYPIEKAMESLNISSNTDNASIMSADIKEPKKTLALKQPKDCKLVIQNFPSACLVYPLKETIILLAFKMAITITHEDILCAQIMPSKRSESYTFSNVVLLTEFKSIDIKIQFLQFKNRLKFDATTQNVKFKEFIDDSCYQLFSYANRKLRGNVYEYIACKDSKVIARKKLTDSEEIVIQDRHHVDSLFLKSRGPLGNAFRWF